MTILHDIAHAAIRCREAQRGYFRTRDPQALRDSKAAEKSLDDLLERLQAEAEGARQTTLFDLEITKGPTP